MNAQRHAFDQRVYQTWADYWGCSPGLFARPGVSLHPRKHRGGSAGIHIWTICRHAFIEHDPAHTEQVRQITARLPADAKVCAESVALGWPAQEIDAVTVGWLFHLFPADLPERHLPGGFAIRRLTAGDQEELRGLQETNSPQEVSEACVAVDHEIAYGVFQLRSQGKTPRLVTAASAYERASFVDPGVLTHPDFRGRGFGRAAVHVLCQWAIGQDRIMQYRCNRENIASYAIARRLGFTRYVTQESVWLR